MRPLHLLLAGLLALQAGACMPGRGPIAAASAETAPKTTVAVPTKLTSNGAEPASTLILGVQ